MGCCAPLTLNQRDRIDPTRTIVLRRKYEAEMKRRFRRLRQLVRVAIFELDALGLRPVVVNARPPRRRAFAFERPEEKVAAFMEWLQEAQRQEILDVQTGTTLSTAARESWQNVYIDTAYQRGLSRSATTIRASGAEVEDSWVEGAFYRPIHADAIGLIHTRAFTDLQGVTEAMGTQMSRVLARGLAEGVGARELAKRMADGVESISKTRAATLARTEVIAAYSEASLNGYQEAGVEGVMVEAEFTTSGDNKVCRECAALEGKIYTLQEARGVLPVHPNCRCAWNPVVNSPSGLHLR